MGKRFLLGKGGRLGAGIIFLLLFFIIILNILTFLLPPPDLSAERNTIFYDQKGDFLGEERGVESRYWVSLDQVPDYLIDATIVTEDQHFYDHFGFDFPRILSAIFTNLTHGSLKEGASTISQQYARNLFLNHEKTWTRKIQEAFYTLRIEKHYSKEDILEGYLNTVYFGHGTYGIEAASRYYFNKKVSELTIAEGALLIAIPKGPSYYSPFINRKRAEERKNLILELLKKAQKISTKQYKEALEETIYYAGEKEKRTSLSPYFQDEALKEAAEILQTDLFKVKTGGYHIYTTLDQGSQRLLEETVKKELSKNENLQIGGIAMEARSGAIRALIGGRNYDLSPFNRASQARRMAGSSFKPFLYYAALENNFTPVTKLKSEQTSFTVDGNTYEPRNFNNYYADEKITLAQALALSDNIYAVKVHLFLGMDQLIDSAEAFGFSNLPRVPSLALGTASVTVKEMANAYSTIATYGKQIEGYTIERIENSAGEVLYEKRKEPKQILNEQSAFLLTDLLTGMFDPALNGYTQVTGTAIADKISHPFAGKSGSTDYDSWMVGFSPSLTTAIWVGYDDHKKLSSPRDYSFAKRIWAQFMEDSHAGKERENFTAPKGVLQARIDPESGLLAGKHCPKTRKMYFKVGTEPRSYCSLHGEEDRTKVEPREEVEDSSFLKRLFDFLFRQKRK